MSIPPKPTGSPREAEARYEKAVHDNPRDAEAWHQLGLAQQSLAKHADAVRAFGKATALDRGKARYHHDFANALIEDGKPDRAITAYRRALRIDDTLSEAHNDLGTAYYEKGWYAEAESCFRRAIALQPDHGIAHANLGAALRAQNRLGEGRRMYQRALWLKLRAALPRFLRWRLPTLPAPTPANQEANADKRLQLALADIAALMLQGQDAQPRCEQALREWPGHPDLLYLAATIAEDRGEPAKAMACIDDAIARKADRAEYHVARSRLLISAARLEEALQAAERALVLDPGSAEVHAILAAVYRTGNRLDLAEKIGRKAVELDPASHTGHSNLSSALWGQGNLVDAEQHAREALRLGPRSIHYQMNLAVILKDAGKMLEARQLYRDAKSRIPGHSGLLLNMGTLALQCEGDIAAARGWYERSAAVAPDHKVTLSESILSLLEDDYATAWPKYESRKHVSGHLERHAPFSALPVWTGEPLAGDHLYVYGEQGLGDEVMFASMLGDVQARASRVTLLCEGRLATLFARSFPAFQVIGVATNAVPPVPAPPTRVIGMGSLGLLFRRAEADFPAHSGYLKTDPAKVAVWREKLEALGPGRKIGISWAGGTFSTGEARRSVSLSQLRPLLELPDTCWVSLQYGKAAATADTFSAETGIVLNTFPGVTDDIDELASLIDALDLVISVCNTTVHVAGAIGKKVLVMAPFLPEWRYGMRGERMIWYPSARVFRQATFDDWESVIAQVRAQIQA